MRLFGRSAAAELEGRDLRLFFNQATAVMTGTMGSRRGMQS